jgi:hypothetical protein
MNDPISRIAEVAQNVLQGGESIVRITLAEPEPDSSADYFTRYKVNIAKQSGDGTSISNPRCVVVKVSSNFGTASLEPETPCGSIGDVG